MEIVCPSDIQEFFLVGYRIHYLSHFRRPKKIGRINSVLRGHAERFFIQQSSVFLAVIFRYRQLSESWWRLHIPQNVCAPFYLSKFTRVKFLYAFAQRNFQPGRLFFFRYSSVAFSMDWLVLVSTILFFTRSFAFCLRSASALDWKDIWRRSVL